MFGSVPFAGTITDRPTGMMSAGVADDRARVDAVPSERVSLQLRVLDDRPPKGPRVRDDDAHLHAAEDMDSAAWNR